MAQPLSWLIELFDKMSGPATKISASLDKTSTSLEKTRVATDKLQTSQVESGKGWSQVAQGIHSVVEIGARAIDIIGGLTGRVVDLGASMLDAAGGAESSRMSFRLLLGSGGGDAVFDYLNRVAKFTQFTRAQLRDLASPLVAQGVDQSLLERIVPATADVGAFFGGGNTAKATQGAQRAVEVFSKILASGKVEADSIKNLGLQGPAIMDRLAQVFGTDVKGFKALEEQGKADPRRIIEVLLEGINAKIGDKVGTGAIDASQTLSALLNKARAIPEALFEGLDQAAGFGPVKEFLGNLLELFDPSSEFGQRVQMKIGGLFTRLFGKVTDGFTGQGGKARMLEVLDAVIDGVDRIATFILDAIPTVNAVLRGFEAFWPTLSVAIKGVSMVFEGWGYIIDSVAGTVRWLIGWGERLGDWAFDFGDIWTALANKMMEFSPFAWLHETAQEFVEGGVSLIDGLIQGMLSGVDRLGDTVRGIGDSTIGWLKEKLGIASPSKVMERLGMFTAEGFAIGVGKGGSMVDDAFAGAFSIDGVADRSRFNSGGGGGPTFTWSGNVIVQGSATPEERKAIGDEFEERARAVYRGLIEEYGLEGA